MADVQVLQSNSNTSLLATVAASFGVAPTQGNLLIAAVTASVGVGSISLSNSGWSTGTSIAVGLAGGLVVFYKVAVAGSDQTITANGTLAAFMDLQIFEYDGIDNASPLDKTASTADSGSGVTSRASGTTATLTQAVELAFAAVALDGSNGGSISWTNSYNTEISTSHLLTADLTTTATTATSSTASWATSRRAAGVILTFFGETGDSYGLKYPLKPRVPLINIQHPISKDLVFDWALAEKMGVTTDLVQKQTATPTGSTGIYGLAGSGYKFGSANTDILTGPTGTFLTSAAFTMMAYFKINTADSTSRRIISYFDVGGGGTNRDMWLEFNTSGTNVLAFGFLDTGGSFPQAQWTSGFAAGSLHVVFGIFDGTTQAIYADGDMTAKATNTPAASYKTGSGTYHIGNHSGASTSLNGELYVTRLWNRILNVQERKQLYTNPWQIYTQPGIGYPNNSF